MEQTWWRNGSSCNWEIGKNWNFFVDWIRRRKPSYRVKESRLKKSLEEVKILEREKENEEYWDCRERKKEKRVLRERKNEQWSNLPNTQILFNSLK
jgi:hypothetical protein